MLGGLICSFLDGIIMGGRTDMSPENKELLERRLTGSVQVSIETELKRRYSWIVLIAVLLTVE